MCASIVGFGRHHYKYAAGREGEGRLTRFSARLGGLLLLGALGCLASAACVVRSAGPGAGTRPAAEAPSGPPMPRAHDLPAVGRGANDPLPPTPGADFTREVLLQHCGRCHRGDLPTRVPRALAVFDLLEEPWYGRLTAEQYGELLRRVRAIDGLPASDVERVESFVRCVRDHDCETRAAEGR